MSMFGHWEIVLIVLAVLILFGGKKIPEFFGGLGKGIRTFKKSMNEGDEEENQKLPDDSK